MRVADGDPEAVRQVPQKLSERLMYVPTTHPPPAIGSSDVKITVRKCDNSFICFSNQRFFKQWAEGAKHETNNVISILLGDFCAAVLSSNDKSPVQVDLGVDHSVKFNQYQIEAISKYVSPLFFELGQPDDKPSVKINESETSTELRKPPAPEVKKVKKSGFFGFLK
jgi:hypothetical protein